MAELIVASFNAHWGRCRFGAARGEPFDVAAVVRDLDADVVVLQEGWRPHEGEAAADALAAEGWHVAETRFVTLDLSGKPKVARPGEGWWTLLMLTRLPVCGRRDLPLPRTPRDPAGLRHAIELTVDADGTPVKVVGFHVSSKLWYAAPVWHLLGLRRQLPALDEPTVVVGDCNLWGPAVSLLLPGWERSVRGRTYPAHRPHSQIDHVLLSRRVECVGAEVLGETGSDHRPVRARLRVTP